MRGSKPRRLLDFRLGHTPRALFVLVAVLGVTSCSPGVEEQCDPILDNRQFMAWVIDPQADIIWSSAGTITTLDGVEDLAPTTDKGWEEVQHAAIALGEAGGLLISSSLSREGAWNEIAQGLIDTAALVEQAALDQNADQVFDYGGRLYNTCVSCHQLYLFPENG